MYFSFYLKLRAQIFDVVTSAPINNVEDINRVTGSIGGVFNDPNEISLEIQSKASEMMGSFLGNIFNIDLLDLYFNIFRKSIFADCKLIDKCRNKISLI